MKPTLDESQPIFQQIAQMIKDDIVDGRLQENEKIASTTELSRFYNINRATAQKGLQSLVETGIVMKKRGVGMFVNEGAKAILLKERQENFYDEFIAPLLDEANRINLKEDQLIDLIMRGKKND